MRRAAPTATIIAADRAEGMLRRAPAGFPRIVADAAAPPFPTACYDVLVAAFVLFHLLDPTAGLREARRLLRTGGTAGIATWGQNHLAPAQRAWTEELDRYGAPPDGPLVSRNEIMNTPGKLKAPLGAACRRLARLGPDARAAFLHSVRSRLENLGPEAFIDRSEVITAIAIAR